MTTNGIAKRIGLLLTLGVAACGVEDPDQPGQPAAGAPASLDERLLALDHDLALGATGDGVRAVNDYLTRYGYFPNQELARAYPTWRPLVAEAPEDPAVYGERTVEAVRKLQTQLGLLETGIVDGRTRALLRSARCGVPDGMGADDPSDKFAHFASRWPGSTVTWRMVNTNDVTLVQARAAARAAFAAWAAQSTLTFTELTAGTADIQITFAAMDGPGHVLGRTPEPANGADATLDTAENWSVAATTPASGVDLQTVLMHELGHGLGLRHSAFSTATMYPTIALGSQNRTLDIDDNVSISAFYDTWRLLPGGARDIGVGRDGSAWVIGTNAVAGGFGIYKWNGAGWSPADGGAVRIAVGPTGVPWVVAANGAIYRRLSNAAGTVGWTLLPGCARDIGVGFGGAAWIIGCNAVAGGFGIYQWSGSAWIASDGGASRIAVGETGVPWVVNSSGTIYRRTSSSPASGQWEVLPGSARDIGIGASNYAWVIGTVAAGGGFSVHVWDEQPQVGSEQDSARKDWIRLPGGGTSISVGPNGRPWLVNNAFQIYTTLR